MEKKHLPVLVLVVIVLVAVGIILAKNSRQPTSQYRLPVAATFERATYTVDGVARVLPKPDGEPPFDSPYIYGNETIGDLNKDGKTDVVFLIAKKTDMGTTFYLATALGIDGGYVGSQTLVLGTDLKMDAITIDGEGMITLSYTDPAEPSGTQMRVLYFAPEAMMFGDASDRISPVSDK